MASNRKTLSASLKQLSLNAATPVGQMRATSLLGGGNPDSRQQLLAGGVSGRSSPQAGLSREATPIAFGKAHMPKAAASTGSEWSKLLSQVASGGLTSFLGGGGLLSFGGMKSLVSGIEGLFGGGKSSPPPLVSFHLPASHNQTINIGGQQIASSLQDHNAAVAQAVKTAMLHSNSLNDVIAEI